MTGNVKVQNLAPAMLDHEQTIQQVEGDGRNSEEIERYEHFAMVPKEGRPTPSGVATAVHSSKIARDTSFGDLEPELQQLAMDLRRSPTGIFLRQPADQVTDLISDLRSTRAAARERQRQYQRNPAR